MVFQRSFCNDTAGFYLEMDRPPISLDLRAFQASERSWALPVPQASTLLFFFKAAFYWKTDEVIFLNSATDLDDATDWRPVRPLGRGGYGLVGLWQKLGRNGTVLDSMAIKQQKYRENDASQACFTTGEDGMSYEAQLMHQFNRENCGNIIKLRGFKDNRPERLWRYYFEFAPHGDLRLLKTNYRAWNTYLPEEFLWHLFHGLATAALALADGEYFSYRDGKQDGRMKDCFVVHFDLKPENVALGDPIDEMPAHFSNYPVAKMMDFGLARLTGPADLYNPIGYWSLATAGYKPPVRQIDTLF